VSSWCSAVCSSTTLQLIAVHDQEEEDPVVVDQDHPGLGLPVILRIIPMTLMKSPEGHLVHLVVHVHLVVDLDLAHASKFSFAG